MDPSEPIREAALSLLPAAHALALRLRDAGLPDALIAGRLELEPESLGPLLSVAEAKLAAAMAASTPSGERSTSVYQRRPPWILTGNARTPQGAPGRSCGYSSPPPVSDTSAARPASSRATGTR
jgi:hypothetical protein